MAFDPTLPQANTLADAVQMRGQLNGLKALIDAVPAVVSAQVDAVNTLPAGQSANVTLSIVAGILHMSFSIPRGDTGDTGLQGPPFANAIMDGVTTLNPGDAAGVSVSFDGTNVHFSFAIPRGNDGATGPQGNDGPQGQQGNDGPQGATGEVSNAALAAAITGTSANTNGVATLDAPFTNDPPTLSDIEVLRAKMNELILALRR